MPKLTALPLVSLFVAMTSTAAAAECAPPNGYSPCVDADQLWVPAGEAHFAAVSAARAAKPGVLSFGIGVSYLHDPVVLDVASPDPDGREVSIVSHALDVTPLFAIGLLHNLELTLATPMALWQGGAGVEGITTQRADPLASTSVRDPRIGFGYALKLMPWLGAKLKLEFKLPLGDEQSLAGEGSFVAAPGLVVDAQHGRFRAGLELGARLRSQAELGGVAQGNQAFIASGVRFDLLTEERLSFGLEAWALPSLVAQPASRADATVTDARYISSEWLLSLGSKLVPRSDVSLLLGAGGALPLSSETRRAAAGPTTENFAGLATPAFRAIFSVRYVPGSSRQEP